MSRLPILLDRQAAACPRCRTLLVTRINDSADKVLAYSISALIILGISCFSPFIAITVQGMSKQIAILDTLSIFYLFNDLALTALLLISIIILPVFYLGGLIALFAIARRPIPAGYTPENSPTIKRLFRFTFHIGDWIQTDIFFVGTLVSITKIADVTLVNVEPAFWFYLLFVLLTIKSTRSIDLHWLCQRLFSSCSTGSVEAGDTHMDGNHQLCLLCHQINPTTSDNSDNCCLRCGNHLHPFNASRSNSLSLAILLAAIALYFPANLYSIMDTTSLGHTTRSTIMDGVILLWQLGSYPIALIILTASIILPTAKMLILFYLLWSQRTVSSDTPAGALEKLKLYRFIEMIGRWSMIDVFVVAILATLVRFGNLMTITPGSAILYFALVVVMTVLATRLFDPRSLWQFDSKQPVRPQASLDGEK